MAVSSSPSSLSPNPSTSFHYLSSSSSSHLFLETIKHSSNRFRTINHRTSCSCSYQTTEVDNQQPHNPNVVSINPKKKKTKQKLRPSFYEQVKDKWSVRIDSQRDKFPWQKFEDQTKFKQEEGDERQFSQFPEEKGENPSLVDSKSFTLGNQLSSAPWVSRSNLIKPQIQNVEKSSSFYSDEVSEFRKESREVIDSSVSFSLGNQLSSAPWVSRGNLNKPQIDSQIENKGRSSFYSDEFRRDSTKLREGSNDERSKFRQELESEVTNGDPEEKERIESTSSPFSEVVGSIIEEEIGDSEGEEVDIVGFLNSRRKPDPIQLPWDKKCVKSMDARRSKAEVAEKTIPETELRRLRNVSLRMKERIKVRAEGVTQQLVERIHEKWKEEEVVKLKFEGPPGFNMKRTSETLETRTGGMVIWRSGSSLVLYRGMTYELPCVQQYTKISQANKIPTSPSTDSVTYGDKNVGLSAATKTQELPGSRASIQYKDSPELMKLNDLNSLLDELGPRFIDWSGPEPLPVDADLLPPVVPGYTPPFRVLPYKVRPNLGNKRTTAYRRLARSSPPHFALGRNRELQGLAMAMSKLWEKNAIAKIAIKRGVLNTRNERMAEELKRLTGGTILSRNKDFIVFYRGNDFLSPHVTEALLGRQKLLDVQQEEEEIARDRASTLLIPKAKTSKGPLVAGTLAETLAAKSRWGNEPSSEDMEEMKKDFTLARHASLVRYLGKKLARAQDKVNKAEKALRKVQQFLSPSELPSDLETITDEERVLFRKMGLSMKAFLLVGRREVFDGTVENMHLHWKYRELVKIIVRGRNFLQVKHIAISLEAESGGLLVSVDKTTQGYAIIVYRGKNYQRPQTIRPKNLLTKRQALARSIELQRREALLHHISDLRKRIELLTSGLDKVEAAKAAGDKLPTVLNDTYFSDDDFEDEGEEAYLGTYNTDDEDEDTSIEELS